MQSKKIEAHEQQFIVTQTVYQTKKQEDNSLEQFFEQAYNAGKKVKKLKFKAIAEVSALPIILYNVPSRTGSNMLPETVAKLANDFENIVAIKEAAGDFEQILELIHTTPKGFMVISGEDKMALPLN